MCGRFTVVLTAEDVQTEFGVTAPEGFQFGSYNVAPSQDIPVIHIDEEGRKELSLMEWGLLPPWATESKPIIRPINARLETVNKTPMFKPLYQKRRALIPAKGFYEWLKKTSPKQPYYFCLEDHALFAFASLWNIYKKGDETILSAALITKEAEGLVKPVHSRMPFVLTKENYDAWLHEAKLPEKSPPLTGHPVSLDVNSPKNNREALIRGISDSG